MTLLTREDDLAAIMASDPIAIADPFPVWTELVEMAPATRVGPVVFVCRYDEVKALYKDPVRLSSRGSVEGSRFDEIVAGLTQEEAEALFEISAFEEKFMVRTDGDEHGRLRRIAHQTFTHRRVVQMEEVVRFHTNRLLDELRGDDEVDLMAGLAWALPLVVICEMLEVPPADRERIHDWSGAIGRNRGGDDPAALLPALAAMRAFRAYIEGHVEERRRHPGTDLVSALTEAHEGERLTEEELHGMFVNLLFAGHETTTNLIAHGLAGMYAQHGQWARLVADPDLATGATEEMLRWVSPVQFSNRVAVEPLRVGDVEIEVGQNVFLMAAAANRDPRVFERPSWIDIERPNARSHLALGIGPHFCLGNALARLEGRVVFETLARRFPEIEIETENLAYRGNWKLRSLVELPATLGPEAAGER